MFKLIFRISLALMLIFSTGAVAASRVNAQNTGAIWTTDSGCATQDKNIYSAGEQVWIGATGFAAGTYSWTITGQPGQASGDPNIVVASAQFRLADPLRFFVFTLIPSQAMIGVNTKSILEARLIIFVALVHLSYQLRR